MKRISWFDILLAVLSAGGLRGKEKKSNTGYQMELNRNMAHCYRISK